MFVHSWPGHFWGLDSSTDAHKTLTATSYCDTSWANDHFSFITSNFTHFYSSIYFLINTGTDEILMWNNYLLGHTSIILSRQFTFYLKICQSSKNSAAYLQNSKHSCWITTLFSNHTTRKSYFWLFLVPR